MSKLIATSAIRGAHAIVKQAQIKTADAIAAKGPECPVAFPNTGYFLPISHAMLGLEIKTLGQMGSVLAECNRLLPPAPADHHWLPYLGNTLDAGMATLLAFEVIEACKTVIGPNPTNGIWLGAADDVIMRERGVEFVDGSAPGFAAVVGAAPDADAAVTLARELQSKNLYVFMAGNVSGVSFAEQLASKGVEMGWPTRLVPFGKDISAAIHALGFASRTALSFGGVKKGDFKKSQTTMDKTTFYEIVEALKSRVSELEVGTFEESAIDFHAKDTICGQVSGREKKLREFAARNDVVIFVAGRSSSNGKVLYEICRETNPQSHFIENETELKQDWFRGCESVGISGATSTPQWLMERVKLAIEDSTGIELSHAGCS